MSVSVTEKDRRYKAMMKRLGKAASNKQLRAQVGVFGDAGKAIHSGGDATVAAVAIFQEYGTIHQDPRPFLAPYVEAHRDEIQSVMRDAALATTFRRDQVSALEEAGAKIASGVKDSMRAGETRDAIGSRVGGK